MMAVGTKGLTGQPAEPIAEFENMTCALAVLLITVVTMRIFSSQKLLV